MNLTINVDDQEFSKIIENGIKGLSNETITELAKNAVSEYLSNERVIQALIFEKDRFGYGTNLDNPRGWFIRLVENSFSIEEIAEYRKKFFNLVDRNGKEIVISAIAEAFANLLVDDGMKTNLKIAFHKVDDLERRLNGST